MPRTLIPLRPNLSVTDSYQEPMYRRTRHRYHQEFDGPPIMPEGPISYIMASYELRSPGYIPESDLEEDPEEDPADYPADRDDDDEEGEEEHPAPDDSVPPSHDKIAPDPPCRGSIRGYRSCYLVEEETTSIDGIWKDAQDDRSLLRGRGGVNLLYRKPIHSPDHRRQRVISELLASDHKRQVQLTKTLRLLKGLQTQMVEFQRQHGPAKGPAQPDAPGEAGSSS
ncbi:hypothetical protein Tco_0796929 [Tanacetum coccineum]